MTLHTREVNSAYPVSREESLETNHWRTLYHEVKSDLTVQKQIFFIVAGAWTLSLIANGSYEIIASIVALISTLAIIVTIIRLNSLYILRLDLPAFTRKADYSQVNDSSIALAFSTAALQIVIFPLWFESIFLAYGLIILCAITSILTWYWQRRKIHKYVLWLAYRQHNKPKSQ